MLFLERAPRSREGALPSGSPTGLRETLLHEGRDVGDRFGMQEQTPANIGRAVDLAIKAALGHVALKLGEGREYRRHRRRGGPIFRLKTLPENTAALDEHGQGGGPSLGVLGLYHLRVGRLEDVAGQTTFVLHAERLYFSVLI